MHYPYLRFPGFKNKAVTLSYDDGCVDDRHLIEILGKYGLKCTFNIPSSFLSVKGRHAHVSKEEILSLYVKSGHEIALHGRKHLKLTEVDLESAKADIFSDKLFWEELLGKNVFGMAYAYSAFDDQIVGMLRALGIVYARGGRETKDFDIPTDWLRMPVTCHHNEKNLDGLMDKFLAPFEKNDEARLFSMYGHSYEFGDENTWHIIENFGKRLGNKEDIWYATNMQVYEYVDAYNRLIFKHATITNPSAFDMYLAYQGGIIIPAHSQVFIK